MLIFQSLQMPLSHNPQHTPPLPTLTFRQLHRDAEVNDPLNEQDDLIGGSIVLHLDQCLLLLRRQFVPDVQLQYIMK